MVPRYEYDMPRRVTMGNKKSVVNSASGPPPGISAMGGSAAPGLRKALCSRRKSSSAISSRMEVVR